MTEQYERFENLPDVREGIRRAVRRHEAARDAAAPATPTGENGTATVVSDPTFPYRRSLANIAEATMMRVVELETEAGKLADQSKALTEIAKKLRAAVVANT